MMPAPCTTYMLYMPPNTVIEQQSVHIPQDSNDVAKQLEFGVDPEVHAFMRATWQGNFWGPWATWTDIPPEKTDQWWHAFIQHYYWDDQFHDEIYLKWKKQTQVTVCGRISQIRRDNRPPAYIKDTDWKAIVARYSTEKAKKKSQSAAASHTSAPTGKKMHKHGAGPHCFVNIEHKMTVEEGEPPSYTALARKTHTDKDGSFLDERTEELVLEVEQAVEEMLQEESPLGDSQTDSTAATNSKRFLINQEYIKRGQTKKGTVYGLDSVQYKNTSPSMPIPVSLQRYLNIEMRMNGFDTTISKVKADINAFKTEFKEGMSSNSATLDIILKTLRSQASTPTASTAQPFQPEAQSQPQRQPQAPVQPQHQPQAPVQSQHQSQAQDQSTAEPQHLITNNQSEIDEWCHKLGL
ncbi:hypothetical protein Bca101_083569 [Brassica carinata]